MSNTENTNIHRHLDEAFAGFAMTAELQDLKEEIRSNLSARVTELVDAGATPEAAAQKAIWELGDAREIIAAEQDVQEQDVQEQFVREHDGGRGSGDSGASSTPVAHQMAAHELNRVRPRPGFVVGVVLLAVIALASLLLLALTLSAGPSSSGPAATVLAGVVLALSAGTITGWSLRQETSRNYPVPTRRAWGYGASAAAAVVGLVLCTLVVVAGAGLLVAGVFVLLGSAVGFIQLGLSQSNRKKPWVRAVAREFAAQDRFSQDPVAAARFGIYTAVNWIVAIAVFVALTFTIGITRSWLALLAGLAVFMVVLARMLFPDGDKDRPRKKK